MTEDIIASIILVCFLLFFGIYILTRRHAVAATPAQVSGNTMADSSTTTTSTTSYSYTSTPSYTSSQTISQAGPPQSYSQTGSLQYHQPSVLAVATAPIRHPSQLGSIVVNQMKDPNAWIADL
jgi:heme/copper-type cytochrome/quinol oxidase subunit 2